MHRSCTIYATNVVLTSLSRNEKQVKASVRSDILVLRLSVGKLRNHYYIQFFCFSRCTACPQNNLQGLFFHRKMNYVLPKAHISPNVALAVRTRCQSFSTHRYFIKKKVTSDFLIISIKRWGSFCPFWVTAAIELHVFKSFVDNHFSIDNFQNSLNNFEENND